ncbi:putative ABC transporter ATP-binding protein [Nocardia brasiliensis NBRC 14402]|nr:putative ABC transporter ATP-binding protein [Nocardia brasiliensis NBRC 14402]SUB40270.1 Probable multidrug resistance ABC transporter ATP-binding/permease protein YheI [Nocardia brasiliensis]
MPMGRAYRARLGETGGVAAELRSLTVDIDTGRWRDTVLTEVDLRVRDGQVTVLLGGPGDGKTMVAYALTGRLPESARTTGEVLVEGRVGYVPQDGIDAFARDRSVGAQLQELASGNGTWTVERACAAAHYPSEALDLLPQHNSAGQIQRAAVAAALLTDPDVLIADSPTASLDQGTAFGVWKSIREYADAGAAVLVITHDLLLLTATGYADQLVIMSKGQVVTAGSMNDLKTSDDSRVRRYFQG